MYENYNFNNQQSDQRFAVTVRVDSYSVRSDLRCDFTRSARSFSAARRRLSQLHHGGRAERAFQPHYRLCQHSSWLVFALYQRSGELQHRYRRGSLLFNTADQNTAFGAAALLLNTTGINNTAVGAAALSNNTTADGNTANGAFALFSNTEGVVNTASGAAALSSNTTGSNNTAYGEEALENSNNNHNTAVGSSALRSNTTGSVNTALGSFAGINVTTADHVICIGINGENVSNSCFIGNIFVVKQP